MRVYILGAILVTLIGLASAYYTNVNIPGAQIPLWDSTRAQFMKCDARIQWFEERIDSNTRKLLIEAAVRNNVDPTTLFVVIATELQDYLHSDQFQDLFPIPIGATHGYAQMSPVPIFRHKLLYRSDVPGLGISYEEFKEYESYILGEPIPYGLALKIKHELQTDPKFVADLLAREVKYIHANLKEGLGTDLTYPKLFFERMSSGQFRLKVLPPTLYSDYDPKVNNEILQLAMLDFATVGAYQSDKILKTKVNLGNPFDINSEGRKRYYNQAFLHAENSSPWSICFRSKEAENWNREVIQKTETNSCRGVDSSVFRLSWTPSCSVTLQKGEKIQKCKSYLKPQVYESMMKTYNNMKKKTCR